MTQLRSLTINEISREPTLQARMTMHAPTVEDYAEQYRAEVNMPPPVVFTDGEHHWAADGFHRLAGAERAGLDKITCEVHEGTLRDAVLHAAGANATHGLARTNDDKRRAVTLLLADAQWSCWSDRRIAKHCAVTAPLVAKVRDEMGLPRGDVRTGADGRAINTGTIGRRRNRSASATVNALQSDIEEPTGAAAPLSDNGLGRGTAANLVESDDVVGGQDPAPSRPADSNEATVPRDECSLVNDLDDIHHALEAVLARLPGDAPEAAQAALGRLIRMASGAFRATFSRGGDE